MKDLEIVVTPLVPNVSTNQISISQFRDNLPLQLERIRTSNRPVWLTHNGRPVALLLAPQTYHETETRRQRLVWLLEGKELSTELRPTVSKKAEQRQITQLDESKRSIENLRDKIQLFKDRERIEYGRIIKPIQENRLQLEQELLREQRKFKKLLGRPSK